MTVVPESTNPTLQQAMEELADLLERAGRCDALRRSIIDDMTHDAYTHPLVADRRTQDASDAIVASLNERIKRAASKITILAPTHTKTTLIARAAQHVPTSGDKLTPQGFHEAYELLWIQAYGSGAVVADTNAIHGTGKAQRGRLTTSARETRGGAVQKKKLSASQRAVIKDQRAFNEKAKIDKRLRKIGKEILGFLDKEQRQPTDWYMKCTKCKKHCEDDWAFCPRCGNRTERIGA